jgi:deoxyguanosine kinase
VLNNKYQKIGVNNLRLVHSARIEICGGIASGKTTLAHLVKKYIRAVEFERFKQNPFWRLFYKDPSEYSFATELTFFLQHCVQIKRRHSKAEMFVCDFSIVQDRAYADINLNGGRLKAFDAVFRQGISELSPTSLIIRLECSAKEELVRIRRRSRAEEGGIEVQYLSDLNKAIKRRVAALPRKTQILTIDSEALDFANDKSDQERVEKNILQALGRRD